MTIENSHPKDWVGLWYKIAKQDAGVNDLISFYKIHVPTMSIEKQIDVSHSQTDGLGGLLSVLKEQGVPLYKSPQSKTKPISHFFKKISILYKARNISKYHHVPWKEFHLSQRAEPVEYDLSVQVLSETETVKVEELAKIQGGSVNSWILFHLNKIVSENYLSRPSEGTWLFPVNMRGGIKNRPFEMNNSSAIAVEIKTTDQVSDIHTQIKKSLKNNIHWVVWWSLQMGQLTGTQYMKKVSRRRRENNFCMGTFSNIGEFQSDPSEYVWTFSPPGTPNFPFGMSLMKWNQKLVLALKKHPVVGTVNISSHEILTKLIKKILIS